MDASTNASGRNTNTRLRKAGWQILLDFFEYRSKNPSREDEIELLRRIHEIPGQEAVPLGRINEWFSRRRRQVNKDIYAGIRNNETAACLYPSLKDASSRDALEALLRAHGNLNDVTPATIAIWASAITANPEDVQKWIDLKRARTQPRTSDQVATGSVSVGTCALPASHLPTPSQSTSPEPLFLPRSPSPPFTTLIQEPSSPAGRERVLRILQTALGPLECRNLAEAFGSSSSMFASDMQQDNCSESMLPSPVSPTAPKPLDEHTGLKYYLRQALNDIEHPTEKEPPPRTSDEFREVFQSRESMMQDTLAKLLGTGGHV